MDSTELATHIKALAVANQGDKHDEILTILKKLKNDLVATEEILRTTKAGVAVGKLRTNANAEVSSLAKEIVKRWKEAVEEGKKRKRERDDGAEGRSEEPVKKAKQSDTKPSASASPASKAEPTPTKVEQAPESPSGDTLTTIVTDRKTPRTAKTDGVSSLSADDSQGDNVRDKCVLMVYDALASDSNASNKTLSSRAQEIEKAVFLLHKHNSGNDYRAKMRSLYLNLKDKTNPALRNALVTGELEADRLATMSKEEMASDRLKSLNAQIEKENLFKALAAGETMAETDAFKCGRCQQRKCTYYQMQTRSADEPMTTFVNCTNCGNRWKFS